MQIASRAAVLCMIAFVPLAAGAQATTVSFQADLGKALAQPGGQIAVGGVQWTCNTVHCSGKGPASDSVAACHALSQRFGALKTFSAAGRSVDVKKCAAAPTAMKVIAPVGVAATVSQPVAKPSAAPSSKQQSAGPSTAQAPKPPAPPPPAAPPAKKAAAPAAAASASGIIAVHTQSLRVSGTGPVGAVVGATGTIAVRTTGLRVTGTGPVAAAGASATPIVVRTATLSVTGTGPVVSH